MKKFIGLLLLLVVQAAILKQVNEGQNPIFNVNDTLISTMGLYRMTLQTQNCTLKIEKFDSNLLKYSPYRSCYSKYFSGGSCNFLTVKNGTLRTDNGTIYAKLSNQNYADTALVIDDTGAIQL